MIKYLKRFFLLCGILSTFLIVLAFTTLPFYVYHWLGVSLSGISDEPEYIIFLGGGGMPSESNLIRSYYVAEAAKSFPDSKVIVAVPGLLYKVDSTPRLVADELNLRGVNTGRILFENMGTNTRSQALNISLLGEEKVKNSSSILLVTSPEHMRRAVLCFRKLGYKEINALPAFEENIEVDLTFNDDLLGGNKLLIPDIGKNKNIRYQFWNHLKYEVLILREFSALAYYKVRGWI